MNKTKRVFSDELNRNNSYVEEHSKIKLMDGESLKEYLICNNEFFVSDLVNLLDSHALSAAASGRAMILNKNIDDDNEMSAFKAKFSYLMSEEFLFDNKSSFSGLVNKREYLKQFIDSVIFSGLPLNEKKESIRNEVQIMKVAISNHIIGVMNRSKSRDNGVKDFLENYGQYEDFDYFRNREKA
ncbi:hypothetical protein [Pseudomonas aeruginosa]|uniref:hypothetical protein n=1 Tax=Pseudomonas aeruginosa TaxID=287 RepID=UPI00104D5441|nr:hypothetical protein [Pseudomonas aeruginosa]